MSTVVLIVVGLLAIWLYTVVDDKRAAAQARREAALRREALEASRQIDAEYHRARRHMNDATGQSWRNLVE